ncbi:group II intron reverse transcriptase/maturase [Paraburkholderia sp. BR10936]|uniref:group II intron reverse transcriptase/maturase n=1 Tax=Paraburkholderia sp. BR10936 TaxID=3236993 RepID=UPI0034D189EE
MNADALACASPAKEVTWHQINWSNCHSNVRRLQARIVKATRNGRWGKVKALQHLLTNSFSGKAVAVRRVTENRGKKTPGVDGTTWSTPDAKAKAIPSLRRRGYRPQPLRRVMIPKASGGTRPLGIPTMKDRAMQALHLLALSPVAETTADPSSYGFRPERSCADAIQHCFLIFRRRNAAQWILEGDIKGCFDNISHDWMIANIPTDNVILRKWLKAGYVEQGRLFDTDAGTPQGGIISPVLANMTLDGLNALLPKKLFGRARLSAQINVVRYADDFVISARSREWIETEILPKVTAFLAARGLTLSATKTKITHIDDGFDFLGQTVRRYNGQLLIKPSKESMNNFLREVRTVIKGHRSGTQAALIKRLNPMITGWANYHRAVVSKKIFSRVDSEIWHMLWRWIKRRHPGKGKRWMVAKYFRRKNHRHWVFSCAESQPSADRTVNLRNMADTKIERHTKIQQERNCYDPKDEQYFEQRLSSKMWKSLEGRKQLIRLWMAQGGDCPVCSQKLADDKTWDSHHIVRRSLGGSDGNANRVLLHPNCHRQVHSQGITVVKPAPVKRSFMEA